MVTGGSSGIGNAIVKRFLAEGAVVTVGSRSAPDFSESVPRCGDGRSRLEWVSTDVRIPEQVAQLLARAAERARVAVLVNNAGVQVERRVDETEDAEYDRVMDVNVRGIFNTIRVAVPLMRASGGGHIINIGSTSATHADRGMAVYNASKGAVHALTKAVAVDHGPEGIRCNAISPGWIATSMAEAGFALADDPEAAREAAVRAHPVQRLGRPEDVANLAVWLAGPDSSFVSGSLFVIDGGLTAQNPIGTT